MNCTIFWPGLAGISGPANPQITLLLKPGLDLPRDIRLPGFMAADLEPGRNWILDRIRVLRAPDPTVLVALARTSDAVLLIRDPTPRVGALFHGCTVFAADPQRTRHEGSHYIEAAFALQRDIPGVTAIHRQKFATFSARIGRFNRAWVLATGPSIEAYPNYTFEDDLVIGCNSILKNDDLLRHTGMTLLVCADPVFHFGVSRYAGVFRAELMRKVQAYDLTVVIPLRYHRLITTHYPDLADRIIGVPTRADGPFNLSLSDSFYVKGTENILTLLQLPLAATFADRIVAMGCDGRSLEEDSHFWQHNDSVQLTRDMQSVRDAHPAFFAINYNAYYRTHCATLAEMVAQAETRQLTIQHAGISHIPALAQRPFQPGSDTLNVV